MSGAVTFVWDGWEPLLRIALVGAVGYAALLVLIRAAGKRTLGRMNAFDFVVTVAIGATFGSALTGQGVALTEAVTAFAVIVLLQYVVGRARQRWPAVERAVTAGPTLVFFRGRPLPEAMRRERVTDGDLRTAVLEHGRGSLDDVDAIVLQPDGNLAVLTAGDVGDAELLDPPPS